MSLSTELRGSKLSLHAWWVAGCEVRWIGAILTTSVTFSAASEIYSSVQTKPHGQLLKSADLHSNVPRGRPHPPGLWCCACYSGTKDTWEADELHRTAQLCVQCEHVSHVSYRGVGTT